MKRKMSTGAVGEAIRDLTTLNDRYFSSVAGRGGELFFLNNFLWRVYDEYRNIRSFAATYYVDAVSGSDSNDGLTPAAAWQTIGKINGLSAATLTPATRVLFKRGCKWREALTLPALIKGTQGNPVVFADYGEGARPCISGFNIITGFSLVSGCYDAAVTTSPTIVMVNGTKGTKKASKAACTTSGDWFWVANVLSVYYASDPSGLVEASIRTYCIEANVTRSGIVVDGFKVEGSISAAIYMRAPNSLILNCEITNMGDSSGYSGVLLSAKNILVANCYIHDFGGSGVLAGTEVFNCAVIGNVFKNLYFGAYPTGNGRGVALSGCTSVIVLYNNFDSCLLGTSQVTDKDSIVAYNLFNRSKINNINMQTGVAGYPRKICNNTIVHGPANNAGHGIVVEDVVANAGYAIIKNNIVILSYYGSDGTSLNAFCIQYSTMLGIEIDHNLIFKVAGSTTNNLYYIDSVNYTSLAAFQAALASMTNIAGKAVHDVYADPLVVSSVTPDLHLQTASPAIGAGAEIGYHVDYDTVFIAGVPTIGAYEYIT